MASKKKTATEKQAETEQETQAETASETQAETETETASETETETQAETASYNPKGTYARKVCREQVSEFMAILDNDELDLESKADALIVLGKNDEKPFPLATALGSAIKGYLDHKLDKQALETAQTAVKTAQGRNAQAETLALIASETEPEKQATILGNMSVLVGDIAKAESVAQAKVQSITFGASETFIERLVVGLMHNTDQTSALGSSTRASEKKNSIEQAVYRAIYKSKYYRFAWVSESDYHFYSVVGEKTTRLFSASDILTSDRLQGKPCTVRSITMARKAIKAYLVGYQGFGKTDAIAQGFAQGFEYFSAGNHTSSNWQQVSNDPTAWLAQAIKGTLPTEPMKPEK